MTYLSNPDFVQGAASIATILFSFFIGVQLLVATGIIPISILWGGRKSELTPSLRAASVAAAAVLGAFIYIIRYRAGFAGSTPQPILIKVLAWVVTAYLAMNALGNFTSTSRVERFLFGPLTVVLTLSSLIVAVSRLAG